MTPKAFKVFHTGHESVGLVRSFVELADDVSQGGLIEESSGELLGEMFAFEFFVEGVLPGGSVVFVEAVFDGLLFLLDVFF